MPTITRAGATVAYDVEGPEDGPVVLLYHGTTMNRLAWDMVQELPGDVARLLHARVSA